MLTAIKECVSHHLERLKHCAASVTIAGLHPPRAGVSAETPAISVDLSQTCGTRRGHQFKFFSGAWMAGVAKDRMKSVSMNTATTRRRDTWLSIGMPDSIRPANATPIIGPALVITGPVLATPYVMASLSE